jgi:hypothetical protein
VRRLLVAALALADEAVDEVLYRPAVVKAFAWLPRWYLCDLAKLSLRLDDRWHTGRWDADSWVPGGPCDACGRRAATTVLGGLEPGDDLVGDYLERHPLHLCGWCDVEGRILSAEDARPALAAARVRSVAWRWRWKPTWEEP